MGKIVVLRFFFVGYIFYFDVKHPLKYFFTSVSGLALHFYTMRIYLGYKSAYEIKTFDFYVKHLRF